MTSSGAVPPDTIEGTPLSDAQRGSEDLAVELALRRAKRREMLARFAIPAVLVLLLILFQSQNSHFLTGDNLKSVVENAALPAIIASGLTLVLILNQFDLSFQAVAGLATTLSAVLLVTDGLSPYLTLLIVCAVGVLVGLINGFLIAKLALSALIVTIAMASLMNGTEFAVTHNAPVPGIPSGFIAFARSTVMGIPTLVVIALIIAAVLWFTIDKTPYGRELRAVGGNPDAARFAGVDVKRITIIAFVITGVCASIAGFLYTGRQGVIYPLTGLQVLLPSFAACFLGASMFRIGEFNIPGTLVGVLLAEVVVNGLLLAGVANYATYFFQGGILIAAILFARFVGGSREVH